MSDPTTYPAATPQPTAGWYTDPEQPAGERYWDGRTWTEHRRTAAAPMYDAAPANRQTVKNPQATTALVLGIIGMLVGFWGIVPLIALIFGIIGLTDSRQLPHPDQPGKFVGKTASIWGIVLGSIGIIYGIYTLTQLA